MTLNPFAHIAVGVVSLALMLGIAQAQGGPKVQPSPGDRNFVRQALYGDFAEIGAAKLALARASRSDIQGYAQQMIDDFEAMDKRLRPIASEAGIAIPSASSASSQGELNHLAGLSGAAFDRRYISDELIAHQDMVSLFAKESKLGIYPALQYVAGQTQPTLLAHQRIIEQIAAGTTNGQEPPAPPLGWSYQPPHAAH